MINILNAEIPTPSLYNMIQIFLHTKTGTVLPSRMRFKCSFEFARAKFTDNVYFSTSDK